MATTNLRIEIIERDSRTEQNVTLDTNTVLENLPQVFKDKFELETVEQVKAKASSWDVFAPLTSFGNSNTIEKAFGNLQMEIQVTTYPEMSDSCLWNEEKVKSTVKDLLKSGNFTQSSLSRESPLSQGLISQIVNDKYRGQIGRDKIRLFKQWYERHNLNERNEQSEPSSKKRRVAYDPITEVPKLQWWYQANNGKTDEHKLRKYAEELNQGPFREHREKIRVENIRTWFKNKRQSAGATNATTGDSTSGNTTGNTNQPDTTEL